MGNFLESVGQIVLQYDGWSYLFIAIAIVIQGELAVFLSVYFIEQGNLEWYGFIVAALLGLVIGETLIYFLFRTTKASAFGLWIEKKIPHNHRLHLYIQENIPRFLVISKFISGFNFATIAIAGWMHIEFKKFIRLYLLGMSVWFMTITVLSYGLVQSLSYLHATKVMENIEVGVIVIIVLFLAGEYIAKRIFTKRHAGENTEKTPIEIQS